MLLSGMPEIARAASDVECASYAEETVAQHGQNLSLGCGFTGLRWHDNKIGHFIFCKAAAISVSNAELQLRTTMLAQCSGATPDAAPQAEDQQEQIQDEQDQPPDEVGQDGEDLQPELNDLPDDNVADDEDFIDEG